MHAKKVARCNPAGMKLCSFPPMAAAAAASTFVLADTVSFSSFNTGALCHKLKELVLSEKNDGGTSTNENQATGNVSGTINVRGSELSYKEAVVQGRL